MKLTKENAAEIAARMSAALTGGVRSITKVIDEKPEIKFDEYGLDKNVLLGESANQELPVKVISSFLVLFLVFKVNKTVYYVDSDNSEIEFHGKNMVIINSGIRYGEIKRLELIGGQND